jgi:bidirectional [NiFe] hydrogenase diaphorase subunit
MRKRGHSHDSLIEVLHAVQGAFGYLDLDMLEYVAAALRLPMSTVYGVATFYHLFTMKPQGRHACVVCTGTACYIKGVPELLDAVKEEFGIGLGETTADNGLSLLSARCVGACGIAPVVVIDGETVGNLTPEGLVARLREVMAQDEQPAEDEEVAA